MSREFCESLKMGKSEITDTIFKLPEAKQNNGALETVHNKNNIKVINMSLFSKNREQLELDLVSMILKCLLYFSR